MILPTRSLSVTASPSPLPGGPQLGLGQPEGTRADQHLGLIVDRLAQERAAVALPAHLVAGAPGRSCLRPASRLRYRGRARLLRWPQLGCGRRALRRWRRLGGRQLPPRCVPLLLRIMIHRRYYSPLVRPRRGTTALVGPGGKASLCLGPGFLVDRLVGWVALQVKADGMCEDGMAIGRAQLPRDAAQRGRRDGSSPARRR